MNITLSVPNRAGFVRHYDTLEAAREYAAAVLDVSVDEMIEVEAGEAGTVYCYRTQADADADRDGAYAVQYVMTDDEEPLTVGSRVASGAPGTDDYDTGLIIAMSGTTATVSWNSGVRTEADVADLREVKSDQ